MANFFGNRMKQRVEAREAVVIPTYSLVKKKRKIPKFIPIVSAVIVLIFGTIYLPPMLMEEPDLTTRSSVNLQSAANRNSMEWAQTYLRNNPELDFDNDGLTNEQELSVGTGIYLPDNDGDGTTDYAELYLTETSPTYYDDGIATFVRQSDARTGNSVNTPFKVHDVVMWADDYNSKARGSVIPLADGSYTFYLFQGWVQFPETVEEAYKVVNGTQVKLKKNDNGYFYIDTRGLVNVRVYDTAPDACHIVSLLGNRYMVPDNIIGKFMSLILPSKGFGLITCKPALKNDLDETWNEVAIVNDITTVTLDEYSMERFGRNDLLLQDLSTIFSTIDSGNNIIISLMSHEVGEVYLEVYGYTSRNNLLVCDPTSGEQFGVINVEAIGERVLDKEGAITTYEHFLFAGCGYSSSSRHRMVILDTVPTTGAAEPNGTAEIVDDLSMVNNGDADIESADGEGSAETGAETAEEGDENTVESNGAVG